MNQFLLCLALIGFTSAASAATESVYQEKCTNEKSSDLDETVEIQKAGELFVVTHYGHSRNSYIAGYSVSYASATRFGVTKTLKKVFDHSTWKDMPEQLVVDTFTSGSYVLYGLTDPATPYTFSGHACSILGHLNTVEVADSAPVVAAVPGCHHRAPDCCTEAGDICH